MRVGGLSPAVVYPRARLQAWARVFAIAAAVSLFGAVVFLALASADQVDFEQQRGGAKRR